MGAKRIVLAVAALLACLLPAAAQERHAIVVGIDTYTHKDWRKLTFAVKDAKRAARVLEAKGFNVVQLIDAEATKGQIEAAWKSALDRAGKGSVVLLYFAGHGVELVGKNYLLSFGHEFSRTDVAVLARSSIHLDGLMQDLAAAQKRDGMDELVGVFVIDACRETPAIMEGAKLMQGGLAPVVPPREAFVLYSAGVGQKASDGGPGDANSPFATELFALWAEDMALSEMAQRLRERVYLKARELENEQTPAYYDQLKYSRTLTGAPRDPQKLMLSVFDPAKRARTRQIAPGDTIVDCSLCSEMVVIGAGETRIGAIAGSNAEAHELPQRVVKIAKPFALGKHEVTYQQWQPCVDNGRCRKLPGSDDKRLALHPAAGISWDDARNYIEWLKQVTKRDYRLPTEAEWEHAARSEPGHLFPHGSAVADLCKYANGADRSLGPVLFTSSCDDGFGRRTAPVGSFLPNTRGLFDMSGNVWEWVEDCWHASYKDAPADGRAWKEENGGSCSLRVARGGSWRSGPQSLTASARTAFPHDHSRRTIGLRVAREIMADD